MGDCKERMVCPGEIYRHFKGNLYQIVAVAIHSETAEKMVVYQALYGDFRVYVRPYGLFVDRVDQEKYPDAAQDYRFERVSVPAEGLKGAEDGRKEGKQEAEREPEPGQKHETEQAPNRLLLAFLEAENPEERIACLREMKGRVSQSDLDSIYVVLDMQAGTGSVEEQLEGVLRFLSVQKRFEGGRLR